jgi:hypothetical protein
MQVSPLLIQWEVGPTSGLASVKERKIFISFRESNPGRPTCSSSPYDSNIPAVVSIQANYERIISLRNM